MKMRSRRFIFVMGLVLLTSVWHVRTPAEDSPWRELFDGKDLRGWQVNARPESFTVENGLLKVHGKNGLAHLFYVGEQGKDVIFTDFELIATIRSERNSNSGFFSHQSITAQRQVSEQRLRGAVEQF